MEVAVSGKPGRLAAPLPNGGAPQADDATGSALETGALCVDEFNDRGLMYSCDVYVVRAGRWCALRIYLTERQRDELAAIATHRGKRKSEVIREAVDRFIEQWSHHGRKRVLREAAGIWRDRTDIPDFEAIRASWERD